MTVFGDLIPIKLFFFKEFLLETMEGLIVNMLEIKGIRSVYIEEEMLKTIVLGFSHNQ